MEFWLCAVLHAALLAAVRLGRIHLPEEASVPVQVAVPLLAMASLVSVAHLAHCAHRHEQFLRSCGQVEEEALSFIQELQAALGKVNDVLSLRFVAAKYALAAMYVFFFTITGGTMTTRGWSEIRAKGLLDDEEVRFLDGHYYGDRMALLHIWAMWAAGEACADPAARASLGEEALASGLARMAAALRAGQAAAREVATKIAVPMPYLQVQLYDALIMLTLLLWAAFSAMPAVACAGASVGYAILVFALLGLRESAALLADPLGANDFGFPVASSVNAAADVAAQLLVASSPPAFNPSCSWRDASKAVLTQGQIERRTPKELFSRLGGSPCSWPSAKAPVDGDQLPPPLTGIGCCHLDTEALPQLKSKRIGHGFQVARRPTQEVLGALLSNVRLEADAVDERRKSRSASSTMDSTANPSSACSSVGGHRCQRPAQPSFTGGNGQGAPGDDWDAIANRISALPREPSLASEPVGDSSCTHALHGTVVSGFWTNVDAVGRPFRFPEGAVSPSDVGPVSVANSRDMEHLRQDTLHPGVPPTPGSFSSTPDARRFGCP